MPISRYPATVGIAITTASRATDAIFQCQPDGRPKARRASAELRELPDPVNFPGCCRRASRLRSSEQPGTGQWPTVSGTPVGHPCERPPIPEQPQARHDRHKPSSEAVGRVGSNPRPADYEPGTTGDQRCTARVFPSCSHPGGGRHDRRQGHPLVDHRRRDGRRAGRRIGLLPPCAGVVGQHGESGWLDAMYPLSVDGLIYASSMVLLNDALRGLRPHRLAYCALGLGISATLAANVAAGAGLRRRRSDRRGLASSGPGDLV